MASRTSEALEIRKLRKKLRQIENLERKDGDLLDAELLKVAKKAEIRERLLQLLATSTGDDNESFETSTQSNLSSNYSNNATDSQEVDFSNVEVTVITQEDEADDSYIDVELVDVGDEITQMAEVENVSQNLQNPHNRTDCVEQDAGQDQSSTKVTARQPIKQAIKNNANMKPAQTLPNSSSLESTQSSPKKSKKKNNDKTSQKGQSLRQSLFCVTELHGHSDLITDTDMYGSTLVTASRDTSLKLWDIKTMTELRNFGGHTGSVTSVIILNEQQSAKIYELLDVTDKSGLVVVSGSADCSLKIWSCSTGEIIRSTYTYNPITKICYNPLADVFISSSDGGKLDVWDVQSGESLQSVIAFDESVTCLKVQDLFVYASSAEGIIKVYEIRDKNLHCVFESENVKCTDGLQLTTRCIRGMAVKSNSIYYGDDGVNVKVLNWKTGTVQKLCNHREDFGITDSLQIDQDILISSAYNLDNGLGYINVRSTEEELYLCSLNDSETDRIISVSSSWLSANELVVVSAGIQLKVWIKSSDNRFESGRKVKPLYYTRLAQHPEDSDDESDLDLSDNEEVMEQQSQTTVPPNNSWTSWCNIV